jgi:hypothetical protein
MAAVAEVLMRDKRSMNHMDPETKLIHMRLEEWARWAKDIGIAGYPRQSQTERAALYGPLGLPQEPLHKPEPMMPDHVARVDSAICRLCDIDRRAIRLYYTAWEPVEVLARKIGRHMRGRQFQNVVRRARWRLAGFLDAMESA